jgi:hypothetical protein
MALVTALLVGLLVCVGVAVAVIVVVALPHLRDGAPILTPEGERLAEQARSRAAQAAQVATSAASSTAGALAERTGALAERIGTAVGGADETPAPAAPPRQVQSAFATPAPGTPVVVEKSSPQERLEQHWVDQQR